MLAAVALAPWAAAWAPGGKWWLPIVAAAIVFPGFAARVRTARVLGAWRWAMAWAVALGASVIVLTQCFPDAAAGAIWRGPEYRDEMLAWITSGSGREGSPALFLPQHALHLAVFVVLCVLTGGFLGLALGAALTAYMSFFVGSFARLASEPFWGSLVAWFPWSVARVAAFVLLGVLAARPLLTAQVVALRPHRPALAGVGCRGPCRRRVAQDAPGAELRSLVRRLAERLKRPIFAERC